MNEAAPTRRPLVLALAFALLWAVVWGGRVLFLHAQPGGVTIEWLVVGAFGLGPLVARLGAWRARCAAPAPALTGLEVALLAALALSWIEPANALGAALAAGLCLRGRPGPEAPWLQRGGQLAVLLGVALLALAYGVWNRPSLEPRLLLALPLLAEACLGPAGGDAGVRRITGAAGVAALALCRYEPLLGVALGAWAAGCAAFAWRGGGRRRAVRWLTAVALVVFGLAVLEVAARLKDGAPVGPDPLGEFLQPGADETPVWTGKGPDEEPIANPVVFNAPPLGPPMHDVEHALEKPAGVRRVLVLGDSFVEGVQVPTDALFHRRLEAALDRDERRVECVAGAHSGWGQAETLEHLREVGLAYAPDLVLVEFLPNNDVSDNLPRLRHAVQVDDVRASWAVPLQLDAGHKGLAGVKLLAGVLDTAWRRVVGRGDSLRDQVYREHPTRRPEDWAEAWARTETLLGELDQAARAGGARLAVVIFPAPGELVSPQPYPAARVRAVCEAQEIPVLDLTPTFAASEWLPAYLPEDHHWTALGHARAAEATAAWVEAEGLLP